MILQSCYAEAAMDVDKKTEIILIEINKSLSHKCSEMAKKYINDSSTLSKSVVNEADHFPGWLGAELNLQFAQHRLEIVKLFKKMC